MLCCALLLSLSACTNQTAAPPEAPVEDLDLGFDDARREAEQAVSGFVVAPGLTATLFAAEPMLTNPTNIDVDARGRVWVCEAVNYRPDYNPHHPWQEAGDRILILEDTDGDGKADARKVYYQGTDINAPLGIVVLGNQVIVSNSPHVIVFTDTDGDDKPDRKAVLFTGLGGLQDDHGIHAFVFGPDGKLYFNYGNAGRQLMDRDGAPVVDRSGNVIDNTGHPYRQGMVFRTDIDGRNVEVLGHNFRNIYEVAVDSYGTLWQSDNDDDGNRGVRINYVMEFGNYGYQDEMTGASWQVRRTGMHPEIPKRHWHLNDPGVVPNLLQTGAGSPTGILVYEGHLLPAVFQNQIIHADAGPNVVRAYPVADAGAGYTAAIVNLLKSTRDQWFRPSDVAVAPDGSILIADWYDATVGGNQAVDQERGRLFRVAPPGAPYQIPAFDVSTPATAVEALKSPNMATRYLAWTALHAGGGDAEAALQTLWQSDNPRYRARALWLLGKMAGRGPAYIDQALQEDDSNLRIVGLRLARHLGLDVIPYVERVVQDPSPQVRREAAIALRHHPAPEAARLWATLAAQHDGIDRWYLEALGIGADRQWDRFFEAWMEQTGDAWKNPAGCDIVWRARTTAALPLLAELINDPATETAERHRYFRAFDFHQGPAKQELLTAFIGGEHPAQSEILTLALLHLADPKAPRTAAVDAALAEALDAASGTQAYLDLLDRFSVADDTETLRRMALDMPDSSFAPEAMRLLLRFGGLASVQDAIDHGDAPTALRQLGTVDSQPAHALLKKVITDSSYALTLRRQAVAALGNTWGGEVQLLGLVREEQMPEALRPGAASILLNVWRADLRQEAETLLGAPPVRDAEALPPVRSLAASVGNPLQGADLFQTHCSPCHQAGSEGVDFGPNLSEIGDKLSKTGLFTAILHPDAGISFGYEGEVVTLKDGSQAVGYVTSQTDEALELRVAGGLTRRYRADEIASRTPLKTSLMPSLQQAMTQQELVDLVAYLHNLKKTPG